MYIYIYIYRYTYIYIIYVYVVIMGNSLVKVLLTETLKPHMSLRTSDDAPARSRPLQRQPPPMEMV